MHKQMYFNQKNYYENNQVNNNNFDKKINKLFQTVNFLQVQRIKDQIKINQLEKIIVGNKKKR